MTAASWLPLHPYRAGIGEPLRRLEDARLLNGRGCYSDDFNLAGQVYAVVVRSPHAQARIIAIETEHARAIRGVLAVLAGADYVADGLGPMTYSPAARHPPDIRLENQCRWHKFGKSIVAVWAPL
jgi:carbon-monoxide dehydrogenase large subunit